MLTQTGGVKEFSQNKVQHALVLVQHVYMNSELTYTSPRYTTVFWVVKKCTDTKSPNLAGTGRNASSTSV